MTEIKMKISNFNAYTSLSQTLPNNKLNGTKYLMHFVNK